jgi:hypothetical protein
VHEDEALRIVPQEFWEAVQTRRKEVRRNRPEGKGRFGFSRDQGGRHAHFPTHLLSGAMVCGVCGAPIAQMSEKAGGYYGCLGAAKGACENRVLVRRKLAEEVIVGAVREQLSRTEQIRYTLGRVEAKVAQFSAHLSETLRAKEVELGAGERHPGNFVDFIGEGRGSQALAKALLKTERRVEAFREELDGLHERSEESEDPPQADGSSTRVRIAQRGGDAGETVSSTPSNQARPFTSRPCTNTKGSRSERSEETEDPPQADRNSTRVRIAKRDGDAGETMSSARDAPEPGASFESRALAVEPAGVELASARQARPDLSCYRETTNGQRPDATVTLTVPLIAMPGTHRPTDPPRGSAPAAFPF